MRAAHGISYALGFLVLVGVASPTLAQVAEEEKATIDRVAERLAIQTEAIRTDVAIAIDQARRASATDPAHAEADLKLALEGLRAATDLDPNVRTQLSQRLLAMIRHVAAKRLAHDERQRTAGDVHARRHARWRALASRDHDEAKVDALMQRFNQLLDDGRFDEAGDVVAIAAAIEPDHLAVSSAATVAQFRAAYEEATAISEAQAPALAQSLFAAQKAATPMSSASPIEYPSVDAWRELSIRRKKYAAGHEQVSSPKEREILKALDAPTRVDFEETPLAEVAEYIGDLHGMDVILDMQALEEQGISSDTPVSMRLRGVSLRSALRLMLRRVDPSLTYTVRDEVLQLTTREAVEDQLTTRRYDVGDLVLPVHDTSFAGQEGMSANGTAQGWGPGRMGQGNANRQNNNQQAMPPFNF